MWRLAHTHGTLLALLNISYGIISIRTQSRNQQLGSRALLASGLLIPGGFFLAGLFAYESTPGLGTLLVPAGASLLALGIFLAAHSVKNEKLAAHAKNSSP